MVLRLRSADALLRSGCNFAGVYPERSEGAQDDIFGLNCLKDKEKSITSLL